MNRNLSIAIIGISVLIVSCAKETTEPVTDTQTISVSDIDLSQINEDAATFYGNFTTIVKAAKLGQKEILTRSGEIDTAGLDPITKELAMLDIEDENGNPISFFDMSEQEQAIFLQHYETINAAELSQKLAICPEAGFMLKEENEVVAECLAIDAALTPTNTNMSSGVLSLNDPDLFFENVHNGMVIVYRRYADQLAELAIGGGGSGGTGNTGDGTVSQETPNVTGRASRLVKALHNYGRRGDILLNLPDANIPGAEWSSGNDFAPVGHSSIILKQIPLTAKLNDTLVVGAWTGEGVNTSYETIEKWSREPSFILGLQSVKWVWDSLLPRKKYTRVSNPALLADKAMGYLGRPYCTNYAKIVIAKAYAPEEFICTTLVWWCSKRVYDINPSPWLSPTVTPSQLYLSENTYIRARIN